MTNKGRVLKKSLKLNKIRIGWTDRALNLRYDIMVAVGVSVWDLEAVLEIRTNKYKVKLNLLFGEVV